MQQERMFLDLLAAVRRFSIDASGMLALPAVDGRAIGARRQSAFT